MQKKKKTLNIIDTTMLKSSTVGNRKQLEKLINPIGGRRPYSNVVTAAVYVRLCVQFSFLYLPPVELWTTFVSILCIDFFAVINCCEIERHTTYSREYY